jgi:mRNA interferase RelE/StbE
MARFDEVIRSVARNHFGWIYSLEIAPRPSGCKKLKGGEGLYRIRVGDYRVIYEIEDAKLVVVVVKIGNRKDIYD